MQVIKASVLGFCFGVKRAVTAAEEAVDKNSVSHHQYEKIYSLGPLIHNPVVLNELESKGVHVLAAEDFPKAEKNSLVIIRAHGTTPDVIQTLEKNGAEVLDATCPRVHASQLLAKKWSSEGYDVVIAGDKNHGEVTGIAGYAEGNAFVVQNEDEAQNLNVSEKTILLSQTTFSPKLFEKITEILRKKNTEIKVFNTICSATMERQNALKEVAEGADGIIVIGGKSSANTRRLFETALTYCKKSILIENEFQIPKEFYALKKIAITAGASTPSSVIDSVEMNLKKNALR